MNIIKRDAKEVVFDVMKIIEAISKANEEVDPGTPDNPNRLSKKEIVSIATDIENYYKEYNTLNITFTNPVSVFDILLLNL